MKYNTIRTFIIPRSGRQRKNVVLRRVVSFMLCFALLFGAFAYRPQKANAIALTSTTASLVFITTFLASCGITVYSNNFEEITAYIDHMIATYIYNTEGQSIPFLEWIGVNSIEDAFSYMSDGVFSIPKIIANKLLGFARYFVQHNELVPDGDPVESTSSSISLNQNVYGIEHSGIFQCKTIALNTIEVFYNGLKAGPNTGFGGNVYLDVDIPCLDNYAYSISCIETTYVGSFTDNNHAWKGIGTGLLFEGVTNGDTLTLSFQVRAVSNQEKMGYADLVINFGEDIYPVIDFSFTPTSQLSVPSDLIGDEIYSLTTNASIPTNASSVDVLNYVADQICDTGLSVESTIGVPVDSAWIWLSNLLDNVVDTLTDIKQTILSIPSTFVNSIKTALQETFVPSQEYVDTFISSLSSTFDNHFSILSYPFSILGQFITRATNASGQEPIFSWPNIYEPFSNKILISAGAYNLRSILQNQVFSSIYDIYMIVVKGFLSFKFIAFLYNWFCDVFHMRNDDFSVDNDDFVDS